MTTSVTTFTESLLSPLDRARTALFVRAARVARLRRVVLEKRRRVPALLLTHAAAALVLSVLAPTLLLVVGPLLLGVPHLLADVRYLVLKPALPRAARVSLLGGSATLLLVRVAELLGLPRLAGLEHGLAALWIASSIVVAAPTLRSLRVAVSLGVTLGLAGLALSWPGQSRLVLAHAHNGVALAVWAFLFCRSRGRALGVIFVLFCAAALLVASPLAWWGFLHGLPASLGLHAFAAADQLAPGIHDTPLALGLVASFAFLQSVHYAVWLHAIPQEATRGEATLSFRMSFRALLADFGWPALGLAVAVVLLVPLSGLLAPLRTQATYLSLATFHAYLELAALALFWVRGQSAAPEHAKAR
jgi:hypothetical protein